MQSTEMRFGENPTDALNFARDRCVLLQRTPMLIGSIRRGGDRRDGAAPNDEVRGHEAHRSIGLAGAVPGT